MTLISQSQIVDEALQTMDAEELRELFRLVFTQLDKKTHALLSTEIVERAARSGDNWAPPGPSDKDIADTLDFVRAAKRIGYSDPSDVDEHLQMGINAFLAKDYESAKIIFEALLVPIFDGSIDLGQEELVEDVLGIETADCAAQFVVATYMMSKPAQRPEAVFAAIKRMSYAGHFRDPIAQLERVGAEPLPDFEVFLQGWSDFVDQLCAGERANRYGIDPDQWRREAAQRLGGTDGLAAIARSTRSPDDFDAWCRELARAKEWKNALAAYSEAAETVADRDYVLAGFLDGAALAASQLGRDDLPEHLERAWRTCPTLLRLRRWLGSSQSKTVLKARTAAALAACPEQDRAQTGFLHLLLGDFKSAADRVAQAPGLGWSMKDHPGHLLFPLFCRLLGDKQDGSRTHRGPYGVRGMDIDEVEALARCKDEPALNAPSPQEILALAGISSIDSPKDRATVLDAMRKAAEKRIEGVTEKKRRRYYGHAANLAAKCVALDDSPVSFDWLIELRREYRRYPALQREFADWGL